MSIDLSHSVLTHLGERYSNAFDWQEDIASVDWAEQNIYLNPDVSPMTGMIDLSRTPHNIEILNDRDKPHVWFQSVLASTQTGKTTALFIAILKELDTDPSMMQLTIPSDKGVSDYVTTKFDPMLRGVESLQIKIEDFQESEKIRLKVARKQVGGGMLFILGNTASNRSSKTVKHMFIDEARLFGKGHVEELIGRTKSFERFFRKIMVVSSLEHEDDEAFLAYERCDCKKELSIICPECNQSFYPSTKEFKFLTKKAYLTQNNIQVDDFNIKHYKKEALKNVYVECPHCAREIKSKEKDTLIDKGKIKFVIVEGNENDTSIGYKENALCTYITQYETIAELLIDANEDPVILSRIYRDYFTEIFNVNTKEIEHESLWLLKSGYRELEVPDDTYKLTMTIDNQKESVYVIINARTYNNNVYTIFRQNIKSNDGDDWRTCKTLFFSDYYDAYGSSYPISALAIDFRGYKRETGEEVKDVNRIDEAKDFVKSLILQLRADGDTERKVFGCYGVDNLADDKPIISRTIDFENDNEKFKIPVINMNNLIIKHSLYLDAEVDGHRIQGSIPRTISKVMDEQGIYEPLDEEDKPSEYKTGLYYIADDIIEREEEVKAEKGKLTQDHFTMHLTGEEYVPSENIYKAKRKRVDYSDCLCMDEALARKLEFSTAERPDPQEGNEALEILKSFRN